jgi:hypothetical protein
LSVSWNWGAGHPAGTVADIATHDQLSIESKGKKIHKNASPSNPAVHVSRSGNDVLKRASELTKESSGGEEASHHEGKAQGKEKAASTTRNGEKHTREKTESEEQETESEEMHEDKKVKLDPKLDPSVENGMTPREKQKEVLRRTTDTAHPEKSGATVTGKRGPGRPRKEETEDADDTPHRGPGRPKKPENEEAAVDEEPHRRGPGRPKKPENEEDSELDLDESAHYRGPGRPKKSKNGDADVQTGEPAHRGPGRPKKAENEELDPEELSEETLEDLEDVCEDEEHEEGKKRGPGRPKKDGTKPPAKKSASVASGDSPAKRTRSKVHAE